MNTAIITGASSGIGREFVMQLMQNDSIDEIWVIARRENRLRELEALSAQRGGCAIRVLALDLTDSEALRRYQNELNRLSPNVTLLINCSGFGRFGDYSEIPVGQSLDMIDLNCKAYTCITETTLPFMSSGGEIILLASCAAFQPLPQFNVYAATKAFTLAYSRALREELKPRKINCLAVCPSWVKTEFIDTAKSTDSGAVKRFFNITTADKVVKKALSDSRRRRAVSVCGILTKCQHLLSRILPTAALMGAWKLLQKP